VTVSLGCWVLLASLEKYRAPSEDVLVSRKLTTPSAVTAEVTTSVYVVLEVTAASDAIVAAFAERALAARPGSESDARSFPQQRGALSRMPWRLRVGSLTTSRAGLDRRPGERRCVHARTVNALEKIDRSQDDDATAGTVSTASPTVAPLPRAPGFDPADAMTTVATRSLLLGSASAAVVLARRRYLHWGCTAAEVASALPGDELVPNVNVTATRAVSIAAADDAVWPWVAQLGQGRGGFYSYDFLENLAGCDIHSAYRIVPEWQSIAVGDEVKLLPEVGLRVALLDPGTVLVLRGGIPMGAVAPPYDFTWAFIVRAQADGTTRLLARERYEYTRRWSSLLVEPVQLISFIMSRRMLRGVKRRAEQRVVGTSGPQDGVTAK
jgi:hypothetical protein